MVYLYNQMLLRGKINKLEINICIGMNLTNIILVKESSN